MAANLAWRPFIFLNMTRRNVWRHLARQRLLREFAEGIGHGLPPFELGDGIADGLSPEAGARLVHGAIGRPASKALARAGTMSFVPEAKGQFELNMRLLANVGDGDGEERDEPFARMLGKGQTYDISDEQARLDLSRVAVMVLSYAAQSARGLGKPIVPQAEVDQGTTLAEKFLIRWHGEADPKHAHAIDAYWSSAAEHGMNASTFTARVITSTGADVAAAFSGAAFPDASFPDTPFSGFEPAVPAEAPAPAPAPAPVAPPPARFEKVTLEATKLFEFDKADIIMPSPKLDEIAAALQADPSVTDVDITGYTDRLGSEQYNLKLSERRANAVRDYLVSKGIDGNRLKAYGKGEANPLVQCNQKQRKALIDCLEPNRRVEVEQITVEKRVQ